MRMNIGLLLMLVAAGALVALFRCGRGGRIVAGVLVALVGAFVLLFYVRHDVAATATVTQRAAVDMSANESIAASSAAWMEEFDAEVYPSARSAARGLGRKWASEVVSRLKKPATAVLISGPSKGDQRVNDALIGGIKTAFPGIHVQVAPRSKTQVDVEAASLEQPLVVRGSFEVQDSARTMRLILTASGQNVAPVNETVRYANRGWAEDLAEWATAQPHNQWIVANSGDPRPSESQATEAAARAAAQMLLPVMRSRLNPTRPTWGPSEDEYVRRILEAEVGARQYVKETFVQTFDRSYARVYREAMLIDTSKSNMDNLAREVGRRLDRRRDTIWGMAASVGAMLIVVYLLYLMINSFTKGYFTWSLRTTAIVVASVGVLLILMLGRF